jgi:hypothetical protein
LLSRYGAVNDGVVLIPVLSILSSLGETAGHTGIGHMGMGIGDLGTGDIDIDIGIDVDGFVGGIGIAIAGVGVGMGGVHCILNRCIETRSSARLATQCLILLRQISDTSVAYKNLVFSIGGHSGAILCVSAFPSQPKVLAASLGLLASLISKDGHFLKPICRTSSGVTDMQFPPSLSRMHGHGSGHIQGSYTRNYTSFWQSEEKQPSEECPHWIEFDIPPNTE